MATDVKITYINNSVDSDKSVIFVFTENVIPTFDALKDGVAWKSIPNIGRGSSGSFTFPIETTIQAEWGSSSKTQPLTAQIGQRYSVVEDDTGIVLQHTGDAFQKNSISLDSKVKVPGGIRASLCKDGKALVTKNIVAYDQKATFILHPKLYWGIASEIQEGQSISSAVLDTDHFFEQDLEGVTDAVVTMSGNPIDGYRFTVDNKI